MNNFLLDLLCSGEDIGSTAADVRHLACQNKHIIGPNVGSLAFAEYPEVGSLRFCNIVDFVHTS